MWLKSTDHHLTQRYNARELLQLPQPPAILSQVHHIPDNNSSEVDLITILMIFIDHESRDNVLGIVRRSVSLWTKVKVNFWVRSGRY